MLIGTGLDESALRVGLAACVVGEDEAPPSEHAALALTRYRIDLAAA